MKRILVFLCALAACAPVPTLQDYRPTVDPGRTNMKKFEADLGECRTIAEQLQADYEKRQADDMALNILSGIVAGAIVGNVYGSHANNDAARGAAIGAVAGAASSDYTDDLVKYGPQRVIDRCLAGRGYTILNDLGRG